MQRISVATFLALSVALIVSSPAFGDHVPTNVVSPTGMPAGDGILQHGDIDWVTNASAAHGVAAPLGEIGPFTRDGRRYIVASDSIYGLTVVDITDPKRPTPISSYASSAGCPTADGRFVASKVEEVAGEPGQLFDVLIDAGLGTVGWENDLSITPDGRIAVIGTDAPGRCHDPEYGGLELVDLSDLHNPRTLHLVRNVGYAHSAGIDPHHPWLAYVSTSDSADFIDIVDFRSCLGGVAQLAQCDPVVARVPFTAQQYPSISNGAGEDIVNTGCHDIRFTKTRAFCAAVDTTVLLDTRQLVNDSGGLTGTLLTSGEHACPTLDATSAPGVKVTDCSGWTEQAWEDRNGVGATMPILSVIEHDDSKPADQDIQISHQAEPIDGGKILAITDERGGGLNEGAPACPGGGIWFYDIRNPKKPVLMKTPSGDAAVFITEHTAPSPFSCTVHYGEQFGSQKILTFAWYTGGTHVIAFSTDYTKKVATIAFDEIAAYIPAGGWTIQAKPIGLDPDDPGRLIVYTADASRGLDVYSVALPTTSASGGSTGGGGGGSRVLGRRALPATGISDPMMGMTLLSIAIVVGAVSRRRQIAERTASANASTSPR